MKEAFAKIIERLEELIEQTYYKAVDGDTEAGIRNMAYHRAKGIVNQVAEKYDKPKLTPEQRQTCWEHSSKDCSTCGQCFGSDINVGSNDGWITLPKVAFDRMIARMESESEMDYEEEPSWFINVRDASRIVFEIAEEYQPKGE